MSHYIATDTAQKAIYGIGDTEDAAIADALSQCAELTGLVAYPATPALVAEVESRGGNLAWGHIPSTGVHCTVDEEEAAQS